MLMRIKLFSRGWGNALTNLRHPRTAKRTDGGKHTVLNLTVFTQTF